MPVIFTFLVPRAYTLGMRRTPNQADSDVTLSTPCDQGKITKKVWKICESLTDFQGQILKQSYFNLLDLADFLMPL